MTPDQERNLRNSLVAEDPDFGKALDSCPPLWKAVCYAMTEASVVYCDQLSRLFPGRIDSFAHRELLKEHFRKLYELDAEVQAYMWKDVARFERTE